MQNQKTPVQVFAQSNPRFSGVVLLLVGAVFMYFSVAAPVLHAPIGAHIAISGKGAIGGGIFVILGLILMLFGGRALSSMQGASSGSKVPIFILGGLLAVVGIIAMETLKAHLRAKGYVL